VQRESEDDGKGRDIDYCEPCRGCKLGNGFPGTSSFKGRQQPLQQTAIERKTTPTAIMQTFTPPCFFSQSAEPVTKDHQRQYTQARKATVRDAYIPVIESQGGPSDGLSHFDEVGIGEEHDGADLVR
jgi:hypothetical protein